MLVKGTCVYLSGPMTGGEDFNRPAFAEAEKTLYELGASWVFNPCEEWRMGGKLPDWTHEQFMLRDLRALTMPRYGSDGVAPWYDVLVLLPGWGMSRGSRVEHDVAHAIGIPCILYTDLLRDTHQADAAQR